MRQKEYKEWLNSSRTKEVLKLLEQYLFDLSVAIGEGKCLKPTMDATAISVTYETGYIAGMNELFKLDELLGMEREGKKDE